MNIAICDDEQIFIDNLRTSLEKLSFKYNIKFNINVFNSGEDLLNNYKPSSYNLIFLDIVMKGLNGIETSKKIRFIDKDVSIVFLTSTIEFAIDGYEVHALNYLLKPVEYTKIEKVILTVCNFEHDNDNIFTFNVNHTLYNIHLNNVNYFEANNRIIYINCIDSEEAETLCFYKKFNDLEKELEPKGFVRCHRSYLVNIKNILSISSKEITFENHETAPISRRLYQNLKDKFLDYASTLVD